MKREITVKGVGRVSAAPDLIVLSMKLESHDYSYDKAMNKASDKIAKLQDALLELGFKKEEIKTSDFDVNTDYNSYKEKEGNYHRDYNGYKVNHRLKLRFNLDMELLSRTLMVISDCLSNPQLSIDFAIKDKTKVNEEMLIEASKNARRKAEILCKASHVKLGQLVRIDYNWSEADIYSRTDFKLSDGMLSGRSIDIEPEDIEISDTVSFVWEIE